MIIKDYEEEYYDQVIALHKTTMMVARAYKGEGIWDDDLKNILSVYTQNNGEFIVGIDENKIVAMGAFKDNKDEYAEIRRMRVAPEYQGKGFGKIIYEELEKRAISRFNGFILETSEIQVSAQKLYLSVGFKEITREIIDSFNASYIRKISLNKITN